MEQPLFDLLHRCTVKLTVRGGHGTGFFVAPGLILTCAHVVKEAGTTPIKVRWQHQHDFAEATIERSLPDSDIALLRCSPPPNTNVPCVLLDTAVEPRDPLYLFGYPDRDFPDGRPVIFDCAGFTGDDPPLIVFQLGQVRPGMSGSPLLNQRTGKVCGVVKLTLDRSIDLGGGAIPTMVILSRWPDLERQNRKCHWRDVRWTELLPRISEGGSGLAPHLSLREHKNRQDLLAQVKEEVAHLLWKSLHHAVLINLLKETRPHEVKPLWGEVKMGTQQGTRLPPETEIIDVFDEETVGGKLLILGTPGAGKTTTLLHLARDLGGRAATDVDEPMPVLLNLSSWQDDDQPIASWLVAELDRIYGVRKDLGQHWLDERSLLPLLDGLDELESARLEKCVEALNQFQRDYRPKHLVVCCRLAESQHSIAKLQLNGAVQLHPLTAEQIESYLVSAGRPELWQILQAHPALLELAQAPLFLSLMTLAFDERSIQELRRSATSTHEYHQYLFTVYIERMFLRDTENQGYSKEKTEQWLAWLAQRLQEQAQTEFLLEQLQPTWLPSPAQKWLYRSGVIVSVILIFALFQWLTDRLMEVGPPSQFSQWLWSTFGLDIGTHYVQYANWILFLIMGLIAGLIVGWRPTITPIETLKWSGEKAWHGVRHGLRRWTMPGLEYGVYVGLIAGVVATSIFTWSLPVRWRSDLVIWGEVGKIVGGIAGLIAGVATGLIARPSVWRRRQLREQLASQWPSAVPYGLMCGLGVGLSWVSPEFQGDKLVVGAIFWLTTGIIAGVSHGLNNHRVFRWVDTLVVGLLGGLGGGMISWVIGGLLLKRLGLGLASWISLWLVGGLGVGATVGLIAGLVAKRREKTTPGEVLHGARREGWHTLGRRVRQELLLGSGAALVLGVLLSVLAGVGKREMIQALAGLTNSLGIGLLMALHMVLLCILGGAVVVAGTSALLGALIEALRGGLTGPEIEQRTAPNQGIRRSAVNVGVFALVGGLTAGGIWGLVNLVVIMLMWGHVPQESWWHSGLGSVLFLGLLCGLVPGAACIQHFALRFVLWCKGMMPWHYVRFLDYATERMFLQRVGGRYRFIHNLLRDHFAAMEPKPGRSIYHYL